MTRKTKKDLELSILRKVFPKRLYKKYTVGEKPDFILLAQENFGVEIVEYYPDETMARLHNMPNYAESVTNETYIHKDDVAKLEVVTTEYQDPKTGKWKKIPTPAVLQEHMPITDRLALLVKLIESKSASLLTYDIELPAIDLIVQDSRNSLLDGINNTFILETFRNFLNNGRFANSGFRNIYILLPPSKGQAQIIARIK